MFKTIIISICTIIFFSLTPSSFSAETSSEVAAVTATLNAAATPIITATPANQPEQKTVDNKAGGSINNNEVKLTLYHCPFAFELIKEGAYWATKDDQWKTSEQYIVNGVDYFIGAQWSGVVLGEVLCLYKGKDGLDFTIALQPKQAILVPEPTSPNWIKRSSPYKGKSFKSCSSKEVMDCPFYTQEKILTKDIYETIKYKGSAN